MAWFRVEDGCLRYRGVTRTPFAYWLETPRGSDTLQAVAGTMRFRLFGRRHAARRALWRELQATAGDERVQAIVRDQARAYHALLATLAFVDALPRATVDLRRVVVVPRVLLNARALQAMHEAIDPLLNATELLGGDALREFFVTALVDEMDRAFMLARPSPHRPVPAREQWATVAVDLHFVWDAPDWSGPIWPGHHYVHEVPRSRLGRRHRNHLKKALAGIDAQMAQWPRAKRHDTVQRAVATFGV